MPSITETRRPSRPTGGTVVRLPVSLARWSARHPWRAIGLWLLLVAVAVTLVVTVPTRQTTDADYRIGESGRADALIAASGPAPPDSELLLLTSTAGRSTPSASGALREAADDLRTTLTGARGVATVAAPVDSPDGDAVLLTATLRAGGGDLSGIAAAVADIGRTHPGVQVRQTGDTSLDEGIDERVADDLQAAEGVSLPLTLVLMLLAFGALIAAGVPVLLALSSVAVTIGVTAPLSHLVHAEPTVSSMIVLIGMAVGVDYSLFYLTRARRERLAGRTVRDAVDIAAATSGHTVVVSGIAVVASMAGLYVIGGATFDSLATGAILVVVTSVLGATTVLPALMVLLGARIDRPRVPLLWRLSGRLADGRISGAVLAPVLRRPVAALLLSVAVLGALAVPALSMRLHDATLSTLPDSIPAVQTMREIGREFASQGAEVDVAVRAPASQHATVARALTGLRERAVATGLVRGLSPAPATSEDRTITTLVLVTPYDESDPRSEHVVRALRSDLVPASLRAAPDARWAVGGDVAMRMDRAAHLSHRLPVVVGLVLLLTFAVMAWSFRSWVIGAVSVVLSALSVGAAFGLLALVFQEGHGQRLLDFDSPGFVIDWVPPFVLVVLVGLSMDYHVFLLAHVRELHRRGLTARDAVARGARGSAGVVSSAAVVMVSVFSIFATLSMMEMEMIGVGLAGAVLLDATLVRLVALPAILTLLGERAWSGRPAARPGSQVETVGPSSGRDQPVTMRT